MEIEQKKGSGTGRPGLDLGITYDAVACHVLPAMRCHASSHSAAVASSTHRFPSRRKSYWGLAISPRVSGGRAP
jgi:hypothetical protein